MLRYIVEWAPALRAANDELQTTNEDLGDALVVRRLQRLCAKVTDGRTWAWDDCRFGMVHGCDQLRMIIDSGEGERLLTVTVGLPPVSWYDRTRAGGAPRRFWPLRTREEVRELMEQTVAQMSNDYGPLRGVRLGPDFELWLRRVHPTQFGELVTRYATEMPEYAFRREEEPSPTR